MISGRKLPQVRCLPKSLLGSSSGPSDGLFFSKDVLVLPFSLVYKLTCFDIESLYNTSMDCTKTSGGIGAKSTSERIQTFFKIKYLSDTIKMDNEYNPNCSIYLFFLCGLQRFGTSGLESPRS